jgi:rhomboid protease GluP
MNMMWLRQLMPAVSQLYGVGRLVIIYTVASAAGFAATSIMGILPMPWPLQGAGFTVGASAPLFGLFGALIAYSQRAGTTHVGQQVWRWVIMFVVIGLLIPMIDNWAHLGGFAGGYLASRWLDPLKDETSKHYLMALVCLVLTFASIVASFLHGAPLFQ